MRRYCGVYGTLIAVVASLLTGCFGHNPPAIDLSPAEPEDAAPIQIGPNGIWRFAGEGADQLRNAPPRRELVGVVYKEVLFGNYTGSFTGTPESVRENDPIDWEQLAESVQSESAGFMVRSVLPDGKIVDTFVDRGDAKTAAELRVVLAPRTVDAVSTRRDNKVRSALIYEIFGRPTRYRTPAVSIEENLSLDFSVGEWNAGKSKTTFRVRAEIEGGGTKTIYEEGPEELARGREWKARTVDLAPLAGKTVRFVFETEPAPTKDAQPDTVVPRWGDVRLARRTSTTPADGPPSILLISLDTLRADFLGAYGFDGDISPAIDALAREGVVWERCYAPTSWTTPSHAALFTGDHPITHRRSPESFWYQIPAAAPTLPEYARRNGYRTAAYTNGLMVGGALGFSRGFQTYSDGVLQFPLPVRAAEQTFGLAQSWLEANGQAPYFGFVHTYEIHAPYMAPEPYHSIWAEGVEPVASFFEDVGARPVSEQRGLYAAGVAYTDAALGTLIESLRTSGALERSIVIVFSDHGEELGEHGRHGHGTTLYEEVLHVPMIIRLPKSHRVIGRSNRPHGLEDLFEPLKEVLESGSADGIRSFLQADLAANDDTSRALLGELRPRLLDMTQTQYRVSIQTDSDKLILSSDASVEASPYMASGESGPVGVEHAENVAGNVAGPHVSAELFNRIADLAESENLAETRPESVERLSGTLLDLVRSYKPEQLGGEGASSGVTLTEEERENLESMGYLGN